MVSSQSKRAKRGLSVKKETFLTGVLLRSLRRERDLTQKEVAQHLGFSRDAAYQKYESGLVIPPSDKLAKLAELFGVTTDYLLGREEPPLEQGMAETASMLSAMGCKLAYHDIMQSIAGQPRKLLEFRKLLEQTLRELRAK